MADNPALRIGTIWNRVAWWHPAGWVLYSNGDTSAWPVGLGEPGADGIRRWTGDMGDGTVRVWEYKPISGLVGGRHIYWIADPADTARNATIPLSHRGYLWSPSTNVRMNPPPPFTQSAGRNSNAEWFGEPVVAPPRADGTPDLRRVAQVTIRANYFNDHVWPSGRWYLIDRVYRVWPPRQYGAGL